MITTRHIYLAYRKLKGQCYYESASLDLRFKLAEWEWPLNKSHFRCSEKTFQKVFKAHVKDFEAFLNHGEPLAVFIDKNKQISVEYAIKEFETVEPVSGFISNKPNTNLNIEKCNMFAVMPVELHLIGVLWVMFLNKYLNRDRIYATHTENCKGHNYGNVVHRDTTADDEYIFDDPKGIQLAVTENYIYKYRNWRNNALTKTQELLDKGDDATIVNLDIKRYYYSVRIDLMRVLDEAVELGVLDKAYREDEDLIRLTDLVDEINDKYTEKIRTIVEHEDNVPFKEPRETLLPVGLHSSNMIANLYLLNFDAAVRNLPGLQYYGRYVDDMLFVFSGSAESKEEFLEEYFLEPGLLQKKEDYYTLNGDKSNLVIQDKKIVIETFSNDGSQAALKIFKKKLLENSSETRFLQDIDTVEDEFESAAFELNYSEANNTIRGIEAFKENKYGASKYLAQKISLASITSDDGNEQQNFGKDIEQIIRFFKGRTCLAFSDLWEKVATLLIIRKDYKNFRRFAIQIQDTIERVGLSEKAESSYELKAIKLSLAKSMGRALAMAGSLYPKFNQNIVKFNREKWYPLIVKLRCANLVRHIYIGLSCINYTNLLENDNFNLCTPFTQNSRLKKWKKNMQFWLSPRFVSYGDISSLALRMAINNYEDKKGIGNISEVVDCYFQQINYIWTGFFKGKMCKSWICYGSMNVPTADDKCALNEIAVDEYEMRNVKKISYNDGDCNKKIGIVNIQIQPKNYTDALNGVPNLSKERRKSLYQLFADTQRKDCKPDLLILPELALPFDWLDLLIDQAKRTQMGLVTGMEYLVTKNKVALNVVVTILPIKNGNHKDCIVVARIKNHYSPKEKVFITGKNKKKLPNTLPYYDLFRWRQSYFSVFNCFELTNISERSVMLGKVDFVVATELNPDTNFYSDIIGSWSRDVHAFIVQVNTSEYGDSRIIQPKDSVHKNLLYVKGGKNTALLVDEIDIKGLREVQLKYVKNYNSSKPIEINSGEHGFFKHTPPLYSESDVQKRINNESFVDSFDKLMKILFN